MNTKSRQELAERVKTMALLMAEVSSEMEYFGGFDEEMRLHAAELANAASTAWQWHEAIEDREPLS